MLCVEDLALYEMAQKEATGSHGNENEEQQSQRPSTSGKHRVQQSTAHLSPGFYRSMSRTTH